MFSARLLQAHNYQSAVPHQSVVFAPARVPLVQHVSWVVLDSSNPLATQELTVLSILNVPPILAKLQIILPPALYHCCLPVLILLFHVQDAIGMLVCICNRIGKLLLGQGAI